MPLVYTQQYRPINSIETAEADGLSSRAIRDHARNANVFKAAQSPRHVWNVGHYPRTAFGTALGSPETYLVQGRVPARRGYTHYRVNLWANLVAPAAAPAIMHVYSDAWWYTGPLQPVPPDTIANYLSPAAQVLALSIPASTNAWYAGDLVIVPRNSYDSVLIMTHEIPVNSDQIEFGAIEVWYRELA